MKITTKQVGARMREARKKKKYTLRYLANKIGLSSRSTISNWELGLNLPNKRYLKKIAKACDTTVDWLLYGDFDRFVRQLLKENFQNKQLLKPPFFTQLMGRLSEEQLSYHDSLKIMIQAQKLQQSFYAFPLTVEAPSHSQESISIYEPTTAEEQSDQSYYHPFILSELHELFTHSQNPELDYSLIIAFLPLLKVDQLTEPQKEVLLAIFKRMNSFKDQTLLNEFFVELQYLL
ncbi:helix-turn-helix domain-containing protein [Enterococcus faecalis]|uniref:helix-turn-helix domain-containing protein n=1 Tax=Enterococcus faecalis TaxID=1351 RepID=UPI00293861E8|nr:helix-turn-helix transcriptional regulator [Enterococcus faecalis]HEC4808661.1 helix-turn-helix transcriptional regulator [Enterococcus faecalis]HEC4811718.1 helix-turn-helix transcriptional regulator [Enterococcus faecalis]